MSNPIADLTAELLRNCDALQAQVRAQPVAAWTHLRAIRDSSQPYVRVDILEGTRATAIDTHYRLELIDVTQPAGSRRARVLTCCDTLPAVEEYAQVMLRRYGTACLSSQQRLTFTRPESRNV